MKALAFVLFMPIIGFAQAERLQQTHELLHNFLRVEQQEVMPSTQRVTNFFARLESHPQSYAKHQQQFARQLFVQTHSRFLKYFRDDANFSQIFSNGNYNCLTATALLAVALKHFRYTFKIFETNHHIFILVDTDRGTVLLETTDAFDGFTTDPHIIQKKIASYKHAVPNGGNSQVIQYRFKTALYHEVTLDQLAGLLHFNLAAKAYNTKDFENAIAHIEEATVSYNSSRLKEFTDVLLLTLQESNVAYGPALTARLRKLQQSPEKSASKF